MLLVGSYHLSLDDKGRLSVPAVWRHTLRKLYAPDDTTLVVTKYFEDCLAAYPQVVWLDIEAQLRTLPNDPQSRALKRQLCASASMCSLDRQGRLLIPPKLRQYAGIDGEVFVLGMSQKLELWSPSRWEVYDAENSRFDNHTRYADLQL